MISKSTAPPVDEPEDDERVVKLREKLGLRRYRESRDQNAKTYLTRLLNATGGDRVTAAAIAGLNRTHLQALIKRHEIDVKPNFKNRGRRRSKRETRCDEATETEAADGVDR